MARKKGQGSIYQRVKGGTYYLQYTINGRKKRVSLKVTHLKDKNINGKIVRGAESKARDILDSIQAARTKQDVVNFVAEQKSIIKKSKIDFQDVMAVIAENYAYTPVQFSNGIENDRIINLAGENEGSCKIFAFGQLHELTEHETLACFGQYYRHDVLQHPHATDHLNIRTFMRHGWDGIQFEYPALSPKT